MYTSQPGAETLEVLLHNELDVTIEYKQWVMTDRAILMIVTAISQTR
jgi:hypothetical protein